MLPNHLLVARYPQLIAASRTWRTVLVTGLCSPLLESSRRLHHSLLSLLLS